jgi:mono/diheme cytochrome c family protein
MKLTTNLLTLFILGIMQITATAQIDYNSQIQPIFNSRCASCHGGISGVFMSNYAAVMSSVGNQYGRTIVEPYSPEESPLYDKLLPNPQFGNRMPQGGSLTQAQIDLIRQWIEEGAFETPATSIGTEDQLIAQFELLGNYPNPFNPSTSIRFSLPESADVEIQIFSLQGQLVDAIRPGSMNQGVHSVSYNAMNLASGVYLYRISASPLNGNRTIRYSESGKFTLIK